MSVSEIKSQLRRLTAAEREEIADALARIAQKEKAAWRKEMLRRHREIKVGKGLTREAALRRYEMSDADLK